MSMQRLRHGPGLSLAVTKLLVLITTTLLPLLTMSSPIVPILHGHYGLTLAKGKGNPKDPEVAPGSAKFWIQLMLIFMLVLLGGCFAGLTLGLMGLDVLNLRVLSTSGTPKEQVRAAKVLKLLDKGRHWVLVVLLLSNVIVNETLPIFLDSVLGGGVLAIVLATALVVIFGEIIPQSICVRYGLAIGAKSAPFVLFLMYLEYPIAYPIAMLLDYMLGHDEGTTYRKAELKTFVGLHRHIGTDGLNEDEVTIISAVLDLSAKTLVDIMTPIEDTFTLSTDSVLDENTITELVSEGYSRVPVHEAGKPRNFIGMLLVKELIIYDPEDAKLVSDFTLRTLPEAAPDMTCLEALNFFQQGRSHMLLVSSAPGEEGGALGIASLEDVIEEMIGEEIVDESDRFVDVAKKIKVVRKPFHGRGTITKGLAPLIKGVIDKRRTLVSAASYGAVDKNGMDHGHLGGGAFDKVKLKGGEPAPRRKMNSRQGSKATSIPTVEVNNSTNEGTPLLFHNTANDTLHTSTSDQEIRLSTSPSVN